MTSQELISALEQCGYEPRSYSGRGMYGKECVGVSDNVDPFELGFKLGVLFGESVDPDDFPYRTDSMGRGMIVYFPRYEWPGSGEEDED